MNKSVHEIIEEQRKNLVDASTERDPKCPFTGSIKLRGRMFTGVVVSKDTHRTVRVSYTVSNYLKKYERVLYKKTKVAAHNPLVIDANVGDEVIIAECRPISKTKRFVVIKNLGHSKDYALKQESIELDAQKAQEKEDAKIETGSEVDSQKEESSKSSKKTTQNEAESS